MHRYFLGYRGMHGAGRFAHMDYLGSPWLFWLMVAFMILVTVTIVLLFLHVGKRRRQANDDSEAMAILKRRYAKGELSNGDFLKMKKDLR